MLPTCPSRDGPAAYFLSAMNKISVILAAAMLALSAACNGNLAPESASGEVFTCVIADAPDTRLSIDAQGKTRWEPGDQILFHGKWTGKGSRTFSVTVTLEESNISADGKTASVTVGEFDPGTTTSGRASLLYAVYPADAITPDNGKTNWRDLHTFNGTNRPLMLGYEKGDGTTSFTFRNLCGVISFSVSGDFDSYTFCGNNGETVGYDGYQASLYWGTDGKEHSDYKKGGTALTSISGTLATGDGAVNYVCLPAGANFSKGFTFNFLKDGNIVKVATTSTAVNVKRNALLPLGDISTHLEDYSGQPSDPEAERLARQGITPIRAIYFTEYTSSSVFPTLEDVRYFTHINVGHARFVNPKTGDGGLVIKNPGPSYINKLVAFKKDYPELKLLLFIGGWGKNADGFSQMAKDDTKRALFCSECVRLCNEYGLDGVDLDWEYPGYSAKTTLDDGTYYYNGSDPADRTNFTRLVKDLRQALGKDKLISYAADSDAEYIDNAAVLEWVDYINVMTYSMGDPNPDNPAKQRHNSPLYKSSRFANSRGTADCIEKFHNQGVPYDRMNFGIGFYGHGDGNVYPSSVSYTIAREALEKGTAKGKSVVGYNIRIWDEESKSVYLGNSSEVMYASYEDAESIGWRVKFVKDKGLLGAFAWEYREDDSSGTLRKAFYDLMTATE